MPRCRLKFRWLLRQTRCLHRTLATVTTRNMTCQVLEIVTLGNGTAGGFFPDGIKLSVDNSTSGD